MGGGNLIIHAAGWMEGGLVASYEKFALDVELLQMIQEFLKPIIVDDDTMGLDAMLEVGPGGHFFGAAHTMTRYATAFHQPLISDWRNFNHGRKPGRRRRRRRPMRCGRRPWPSTASRQWKLRRPRRWTPSFTEDWQKAASRPISDGPGLHFLRQGKF